jgi:tetratricopeptide (TPR) repeat protein
MAIDHPTGRQSVSLGWLWVLASLAVLWAVVPGCAAQRHRDLGMTAWQRGDAPQARYHLEQAVSLDAKLGNKPEVQETLRLATRDSEVLLGQRAEQRQRWDQAVQHYAAAAAVDPKHETSQQALAENRERYIRHLFDTAINQADEAHLEGAAFLLKQVLQQRDDHAQAIEALASLERDATTPTLTLDARQASEQGDWDRAASLLQKSIEANPLHLPSRAERHMLNGRAADDMHHRARAALQTGELDAASAFFQRIQSYRQHDVRTRRGMADVALRRSDDAFAQGDAALAWLYARVALRQVAQDAAAQQRIDRSIDALTEVHQPALSLISDDSPQSQHDTLALLDAVRDRLHPSKLLTLLHQDAELPPTAERYLTRASVRIDALSVETDRVSRQTLTHYYEVLEEASNPELPRLARCVSEAVDDVRSLSRRERRLCAELSNAEAGQDEALTSSLRHQLSDLRRRIDRAEHALRDAQLALDCAPATITIHSTRSRPYTVETHQTQAELHAVWQLADQPPTPLSASHSAEDKTVLDPDPSLGLADDPLALPDTAEMRREVIQRAAKDLSDRLAVETRLLAVDQLLEAASSVASSDPTISRTKTAAAAALLRPIDADGSESLMTSLDATLIEE